MSNDTNIKIKMNNSIFQPIEDSYSRV